MKIEEIREEMKNLTEKCYEQHKAALENWQNGEPEKTWFDSKGNLCIEYENGKWWHYNEKGEWW
ncbi:hypothetical protein ACTM9B_13125 [Lachnospiraceae bacterium HCP1S3_A10]